MCGVALPLYKSLDTPLDTLMSGNTPLSIVAFINVAGLYMGVRVAGSFKFCCVYYMAQLRIFKGFVSCNHEVVPIGIRL
jgi:hypothetical protein